MKSAQYLVVVCKNVKKASLEIPKQVGVKEIEYRHPPNGLL